MTTVELTEFLGEFAMPKRLASMTECGQVAGFEESIDAVRVHGGCRSGFADHVAVLDLLRGTQCPLPGD